MTTGSSFRLAACSDLHFMAWAETLEPVDWVPALYHALQDISAQNPDMVVINGDLTNGKVRDYDLAMRALSQYVHVPVLYTMGNHEYYGFYEEENYSTKLAQERFLHFTKQNAIYFEKSLDNITLFCLSPEALHPHWHDSAWLSTVQLTWLRSRLETCSGPIAVFLHQPVNDTVANSENTCFQSLELVQILSSYPNDVFVVSGHTHQRMDQESQYVLKNGVHYIGGGCVLDPHPQTRFLDISDRDITLRIRDHKSVRWIPDYDLTIPFASKVI
ncbi:metallophosphoesterase family protein [Alicyclobacillus dauci]|uniref:Metallophosphoesterase n=1 Tax=Alicyclobacillus dauci TaxID=1475485 RepID=A0ABY6YYQ8_9BACL|nr:metallophosphoesterase [Alicyclobacillus dauci]WAH35574.1 metallophosphoesterase [Alicyclobacillus dauci]